MELMLIPCREFTTRRYRRMGTTRHCPRVRRAHPRTSTELPPGTLSLAGIGASLDWLARRLVADTFGVPFASGRIVLG